MGLGRQSSVVRKGRGDRGPGLWASHGRVQKWLNESLEYYKVSVRSVPILLRHPRAQVAQVTQIFGKVKHPRGLSELNPFLPRFATTASVQRAVQ